MYRYITKLIKIILLIVLISLFAVMLYEFLHHRFTGIHFPGISEYIVLPMRHLVVFSVAVLLAAASLCLLAFPKPLKRIFSAAWRILQERARIVTVAFILVVLAASSLLLTANPVSVVFPGVQAFYIETDPTLTVDFSETGHFHTGGVTVEIKASEQNARIFFTTDGEMPTVYSAEYVEPLYFAQKDDIYAVVLRAIAVYDVGSAGSRRISQPLTHSYFIGEDIHERFGEDILLFSLSTHPDYLFDHDIGILVDGRLMEDFLRDNPDARRSFRNPANWGMRGREWERPIHVETFTSYGEQVLSQDAGVRVHGYSTRARYQKSLRLIARRDYSPEAGRFHFDFFPDDKANDGSPLTRNDSLTLRNGGSLGGICMLRNELGIALAREAGLLAMPFRYAAVFINGEYYGFSWLQVHISEQYLEDFFSSPAREFDIVSGCEHHFNIGHRNIDGRAIEDLIYKNSFAWKNLLDDVIFAEFEEIVDIDNLLLYYAFQIFWDNCDWPGNNVRRWRYTGEQIPGLAPELDGRWRYHIFDLDWGLGINHSSDGNMFQLVLDEDNPRSLFLKNILTRPDMANMFTMIMCDLAANVINGQTVSEGIDTIFNEGVWNEIDHWAVLRNINVDIIGYNHRLLVDNATHRHEYIFESLSEYFGFGMEMYTVNVSGGEAIIGTQRGTSSRYFNHLVVPVSPVVPEFHEFAYWVLNGERLYEADITVSLADAYNAVVELELIIRHPPPPPLVISELYDVGARNGMTLVNLTDDEIHTSGLFLSNNSNNLQRWALPDMTIAPGETIELVGRGSRAADQMFMVQMNFNVRDGRKFWLSDIDGNIIDSFSLRGAERAVRDLEAIG